MADSDHVSNWRDATDHGPDLDTLQLILLLIREQYELTGRWPTASELRAALRHPGR